MPRPGQAPPPLEIRLFGPVRVAVDGYPARILRPPRYDKLVDPLMYREVQWLVAALALAPDKFIKRETLASWIFSNRSSSVPKKPLKRTEEEQARESLTKSLPILREALEHSIICLDIEDNAIRLRSEGVYVDVSEFERDWQQGNWDKAIGHYGEEGALLDPGPPGEKMPDFAAWVEPRRNALEEQYTHALLMAAEGHLTEKRSEEAQRLAQLALSVDSFSEEACRLLMRAAAAQGRRDRVRREYIRLRDAFSREGMDLAAETCDLYQHLRNEFQREERAQEMARQEAAGPFTEGNIEELTAPLIGRDRELKEVRERLYGTERRLVTLWGPGGVGKTWLALAVAAEVKARYRDGAWFINLASLPRGGGKLIPNQIALALRVVAEPEELLLDKLEHSDRLLVLNNCEHLRDECAAIVHALLAKCHRVRVLATSQTPLGIAAESLVRVRPLRPPTKDLIVPGAITPEVLLHDFPSVALFMDRVQPDIRLTPQNAPAVAQICAHLGGIPLAIAMAAARARTYSVEEIAKRLAEDGRFRLLTKGEQGADGRHGTLSDLLDWSYRLLHEDGQEQQLFRALSVFADGWTPEAAIAVGGVPEDAVLDALDGLVDKALVVEYEGDNRLFLMETMREYAWGKIKNTPEGTHVIDRFLAWCQVLAEEAAGELDGPEQKRWLGTLETEHGNLRAGLRHYWDGARWAEGLRLAARLWPFWNTRNHWREGREWLGLFLAQQEGGPEDRASAHNGASVLATQMDDFEQALAHVQTAREIAEGLGPKMLADVLSTLGFLMNKRGMAKEIPPEARGESLLAFYHRAMREQPEQAIHAERSTFWPLWGLSKDAEQEGHMEEAARRSEDALQVAKRHGNLQQQTLALGTLGIIAQKRGLRSEAAKRMMESLQVAQDLPDLGRVAACLEDFARLAMDCADWKAAVLCCSFAKEARELEGVTDANSDNNYPEITGLCLSHLSDEVYRETWAAGRGLTREGLLQFIPPSVT